MYEQFIILEKYGGDITKKNSTEIHKLLNRVNPVGGRYDLKTTAGIDKFIEEAKKIAKKYDLPTSFDPF